jgi:hypothetical protein
MRCRPLVAYLLLALAGCNRAPETALDTRPDQSPPTSKIAKPATIWPADDPGAADARNARIRQSIEAIYAECGNAADGDWEKWEYETDTYRSALKDRIGALKNLTAWKCEALAGRDLPLFEAGAHFTLSHVVNPDHWREFRQTRAVLAARNWLKQQDIDLIFVPAPAMPEVYVEHFLDEVPADGIIAPHIRQAYLEMLESDVEVVDAFQILRGLRNRELLYLPADNHWNEAGMRAVARDVAARVGRYRFGQQARQAPPVTKSTPGPYLVQGFKDGDPAGDGKGPPWLMSGWSCLTEEQQKIVARVMPKTMDHITLPDGTPVPDDPASPVMLIGNSYAEQFCELLIREMNLPLRSRWASGSTTQSFTAFVREPESLEGVRVIVWVTAHHYMSQFKPMPPPVLLALNDASPAQP